jgi:hypothetical protein
MCLNIKFPTAQFVTFTAQRKLFSLIHGMSIRNAGIHLYNLESQMNHDCPQEEAILFQFQMAPRRTCNSRRTSLSTWLFPAWFISEESVTWNHELGSMWKEATFAWFKALLRYGDPSGQQLEIKLVRQIKRKVLGRADHLFSFHSILSIWYDTDRTENTASSNSSIVALAFLARGTCLLYWYLAMTCFDLLIILRRFYENLHAYQSATRADPFSQ